MTATGEDVVNPIPYPADLRRAVPAARVSSAEPPEPSADSITGWVDLDPGDTGWWG